MCKGEWSPIANNLHVLPNGCDVILGIGLLICVQQTENSYWEEIVRVLVSGGTTTNAASWPHTSTQTGMIHCVTNMHVRAYTNTYIVLHTHTHVCAHTHTHDLTFTQQAHLLPSFTVPLYMYKAYPFTFHLWTITNSFQTEYHIHCWTAMKRGTIDYCTCSRYRMAGNFRGVLIFVIFVTDRQSRKFSPTKINDYEYAHAHKH